MSTVQASDGTSAVTSTSTVNNGATVANAGNANTTTGPTTNTVTLISMADDFGTSIGSKIVENLGTGAATTDRAGVDQVIQTRTIGYNAGATEWIMRGGGVTTTIAGSGYTGFATPGVDYNGAVRDHVHELTTTRRLGTGGGTFDMYAVPSTQITPNFTKGAGAGNVQTLVAPSGLGSHAATDNAATTSRAIPGELTYHYGGLAAPTTDEYKAKDAFEA